MNTECEGLWILNVGLVANRMQGVLNIEFGGVEDGM